MDLNALFPPDRNLIETPKAARFFFEMVENLTFEENLNDICQYDPDFINRVQR